MTLTCPCCRAVSESATCRRCRADLSLLQAVEQKREFHLIAAKRFAADAEYSRALAELQLVESLRPDPEVTQLRAAFLLLQGDYAAALSVYDGCGSR